MKIVVLSDIHANLSALLSVLDDIGRKCTPEGVIILGDIINYGMRPNEVVDVIRNLPYPVLANLRGNHEQALFDGDNSRFSTERGKRLLEYTRSALNETSLQYLHDNCSATGQAAVSLGGKKILAIHGSLSDPYWGKMTDAEISDDKYAEYDYVLSGHSHVPHLIQKFYKCDCPEYRNKKRTIFINPGSVGQPRNHNPRAQYCYIDTDEESFQFFSTRYDIASEQGLYPSFLDDFYKTRLFIGI